MAEFKLGRLRFVWQGDWATGIDYVKDDIVRYGGNTYVCVGAHTSAPNFYTNFDAAKWELMSSGFAWKTTPWTPETFYAENDVVRYGGKLYLCVDGHTSLTEENGGFYASVDAGDWQLFVDGVQWKTSPWSTTTWYKEGDLVRYGGKIYICVDGHTASADFYTDFDAGDWQLFSDGVQWVGAWQAAAWYKEGDIVRYGGKSYICVDGHSANANFYVDFDAGDWQLLNDGQEWKTSPWTKNTWYKEGDLVRYGGKVYICVDGHTSQNDDNGFYTDADAPNSRWQLFSDGQQWKTSPWTASTYYKEGDIVRHGGKTYIAVNGHMSDSTVEGGFELDLDNAEWQLFSDGTQWRTTEWTEETYYRENDLVRYGGRIYICVSGHVSTADLNRFDQDFDAPNSRWQLFSDGTQWKTSQWTASVYYKTNDIVKYGGKTYICINDHYADATQDGGFYVDLSNNEWQLYADGNEWKGNWAIDTYYKLGDIVKYNGLVYVCNEGHTSAATEALGLENDQNLWDTFAENVKYRNDWAPDTRYIVNDLVKFGSSIYNCTTQHTSGSTFDETKWAVFVGGLEFENTWSVNTEYQIGDVVHYGGYSYVATVRNTGVIPSGFPETWEILSTGFVVTGVWSDTRSYKIGELAQYGGSTYVAVVDTTAGDTPTGVASVKWRMVAPGFNWRGPWTSNTDYKVGDAVSWVANTYTCILDHTSVEGGNDQPDNDISAVYWQPLAQGYEGNKLARRGDLLTRSASQNRRLARGEPGQILTVSGYDVVWDYFNKVEKVYYVKTDGIDAPGRGTTLETAFASIKYATEYILEDQANRAPATIFVKTGYYYEENPIVIPANVAIVGDELRSTHVEPAVGKGITSISIASGGSGYSLRPKAEVLLTANRGFLQSEITAWIAEQMAGNTGIWAGFSYDTATCARDVGLIIDAIIYDLNFGGTSKTVFAAKRYYDGAVSKIAGQELQTNASLNQLRDLINSYILTNTTYASYQNVYDQVTNSNNAESGTSTRVTSLIGIITTIISNGLSNSIGAEAPTDAITVEFSAPQMAGGHVPVAEAIVSNGVIVGFDIIKAGAGYTQAPIVTITGKGAGASATSTLKTYNYHNTSMFYMRDGSGLRNMTLAGLEGTLGAQNANLTKRPLIETAYTSLDPATGPGDESAWIVFRSPYVQNVTNFGTACYGLYVDGAVHNGGNKTIVCNDYTQVLNDGIGIYATNQGRVENVSVFCYYCHIGYLAENGGVIRSTNGNSSYGTYGVVAEGVDPTEVSRTAKVDNQRLQAQVANTLVDGEGIIQLEFLNAGENYTPENTTINFTGSGNNDISISAINVVNGGVKEVRILNAGEDFLAVVNNAQTGDDLTIRLSASDTQVTDAYKGERIVIIDGQGVGQYGYITYFNGGTKLAVIAKESFTPLTITAANGSNEFITESTDTLIVNQPIIMTVSGTNAVFGGVSEGSVYYVKTKNVNGTNFTVSTLPGGTTFTLSAYAGGDEMTLHAVGWERFQGTAVETVLDTTSRYSIEPRVIFSTGSGATATAAISKGVDTISLDSTGGHFQVAPTVLISGTEANAQGSVATTSISGSVYKVQIRESGSGYVTQPDVAFIGGGGSNAAGTANLVKTITSVSLIDGGIGFGLPPKVLITGSGYNNDGYISATITQVIGAIDVTNSGSNYTSPPVVSITGGGGEGAAATALLSAEVVGAIIIEGGSNYLPTDTVTIVPSAGDTIGDGATARLIVDNDEVGGPGVVTGIEILNNGSGYTKAPVIIITSATGSDASALAQINGHIASVTVNTRGRSYNSPPTVTFVGGGGAGAIGVALLTGSVDTLEIINGGSGFTGSATLQIQGASDFSYDETKCSRDVGLILDAVTTDMVFDSNYASVAAGLAYLRSYSSLVLTDQSAETIDALNEAKRIALAQTSNLTSRTRITTNFGIITSIINAGNDSTVPTLQFTQPDNVDIGVVYAASALQDNKAFLKEEVGAWIDAQIAGGTGIWNGFSLTSEQKTTCKRDVGYVIDALTYDLLYGGNKQTLNAANAYYRGVTNYIVGEVEQTVAAFNYLQSIISDVVQGIDITNFYTGGLGDPEQVIPVTGEEGSVAAGTALEGLIGIIEDVVADGTTATTEVAPTFANGDADQYVEKQAIDTATPVIQSGVISYIELNFLGGTGASASATVSNIVDSVTITNTGSGYTSVPTVAITGGGGAGCLATVILDGKLQPITVATPGKNYTTTPTVTFVGGKNYSSVVAGEAYYKNASGQVAIGFSQVTQTLAAIEYLKTIINAVANDTDLVTPRQVILDRKPLADFPVYNGGTSYSYSGTGTSYVAGDGLNGADVGQGLLSMVAVATNYTPIGGNFETALDSANIGDVLELVSNGVSYFLTLAAVPTRTGVSSPYDYTVVVEESPATSITDIDTIAIGGTLTTLTINPSETAKTSFWIDVIKAIIQNGNDNANAASILEDNIAFVAAEAAAWATANATSTYTTADLTKRVKLITTAIATDLASYGVDNTVAVGLKYGQTFSGAGSDVDIPALLTFLEDIIQDVITNTTRVPVLNTDGVTQSFSPLLTTETTAPTSVTNCFGLLGSIVDLDFELGTPGNSDFAQVLTANIPWIKAEVIEQVKFVYPSLEYNQTLCARDVGLIIEALARDIVSSMDNTGVAIATTTNVLSAITPTTGGEGYGLGTTVSFSDDLGSGIPPEAEPIITNGVITGFNITKFGKGFTNPPTVTVNSDTGTGAFARSYVLGGVLQEIRIIHPGEGYSAAPYINLVDPNNTVDAVLEVRTGNGVLDQPSFSNRGTGYLAAESFINGDGYADIYQTGEFLYVQNMTNVPTPGANVQFDGNDAFYKLVSVREVYGPTGIIGARSLISSNKEFIKAQIIPFINAAHPNLNYDETLCARDAGLILDAVISDIFGDTEKSIEAGKSYFRNVSSLTAISGEQGVATIEAIDKILDYLEDIVQNITITRNQLVQLQVKEPLITTGAQAIPAITTSINIIKDIITNGEDIAGVADLLLDNKLYIEAEIIAFVNTTYPEFE